MVNPWKLLGVHRKSTDEEIRNRYLLFAKEYHPDVGGDATKFNIINKAYSMLKSAVIRRAWLEYFTGSMGQCNTCGGSGVKSKSKGLTSKEYTACKDCSGAGFNIKEEEDDVRTIELRGTVGTGGKGRHKKR